jgi:hypothetical protein
MVNVDVVSDPYCGNGAVGDGLVGGQGDSGSNGDYDG